MAGKQLTCIVGCYSLHLYCARYCDVLNRPGEYTGHTLSDCLREARHDGWLVNTRNNHALCPRCSRKPRVRALPTTSREG